MSVAFRELSGSPVEWYGPEGAGARRHLICAWDDRHMLVGELFGDGYEFGGSRRANYPGTANIVAMRARVEPFGNDLLANTQTALTEGLNTYRGFARVTVDYELLAPADRDDLPASPAGSFLTYRMSRDYETLTLPTDGLKWDNQPAAEVPDDALAAVRLPVIVHCLTWHRVVRPPWSAIRAAAGTVNNALFIGAAPGTLLFDGATAQREFLRIADTDEAEFAWRIEYVFRERTATLLVPEAVGGWNHQWRPQPAEDAGWDRLHTAAAANHHLYRTADFAALLEYEKE